MEIIWVLPQQIKLVKTTKKEVIIMLENKDFIEPMLIKYEEKLDQVTRGFELGSPPTDASTYD